MFIKGAPTIIISYPIEQYMYKTITVITVLLP